jgi:hypothetical protein
MDGIANRVYMYISLEWYDANAAAIAQDRQEMERSLAWVNAPTRHAARSLSLLHVTFAFEVADLPELGWWSWSSGQVRLQQAPVAPSRPCSGVRKKELAKLSHLA